MDTALTTFCEAVDVGSITSGDEADFFRNLFPENYETKIISYHFNDYECTGGSCHARIALRTKDDFIEWLDHHQRKSGIVYRLRRTRRSDGKYCLYKADYRCQHNTLAHYNKSKNPSKKHTLCPAKLSVTIKTAPRKTRSKDAYLKCYPAVIHINHVHNHPIQMMDHQPQQRPPVAIIKQKYLSLLKVNRTPVQPVELQPSDLMEVQENYFDGVTQLGQPEGPNVNWIYLPNVDKIDELNLQSFQGSDIYEISEVKNSAQGTTYVVNMKNEGIPIDPEGRTIRLVASGANGEQYELHMENNNEMAIHESAAHLIEPEDKMKEEDEIDDEEKTTEECQEESPHYIQQLEFLFMNIIEDVKIHYNNSPEEFNLAIQTACNNYHNITNESALLSALSSFGKQTLVSKSSSSSSTTTTTVPQTNICVVVQKQSDEHSPLKTEGILNSQHNTVVIDFNEHCYAKNKNIV